MDDTRIKRASNKLFWMARTAEKSPAEFYSAVVRLCERERAAGEETLRARLEKAEELLLKSVERLCRRLSHYVLDADDRRLANDIIADVAALEVGEHA